MAHNESHVCDVALSPTRAKGHVAERRAAAPRSPRHPKGVPMHIRAVMRSCAEGFQSDPSSLFRCNNLEEAIYTDDLDHSENRKL
jgi:hypothetical protein